MNPISLYIHIPYCIHKCGYCDFNSHNINTEEMDDYVDALLLEIDHYIESEKTAQISFNNRKVNTIFFGGGTPTILPSKSLNRILNYCRNKFELSTDCEITVEANPATIGTDILKKLRSGFQSQTNILDISLLDINSGRSNRPTSRDFIMMTILTATAESMKNVCSVSVQTIVLIPPLKHSGAA